MEECSIDSAGSLSEVCHDVLGQALDVEDTGSGGIVVDSAIFVAASRTILTELRSIEVPSFQVLVAPICRANIRNEEYVQLHSFLPSLC